MLSTSYEFTARSKQEVTRPSLLSAWTLAGFAVVVMIPLVMIFPKQDLLQQAAQQRLGDALTISYLINLLKADPGNLELRVMLAEHRIFLHEEKGILELLDPVINSKSPAWQQKGLLAKYKFLSSRFQASAPGSAQRAEFHRLRLAAFMKLHALDWPMPTLVYLAGQADQLNENGISSLLYRKIDDASAMMSTDWFAATAARTLGEQNFKLAAHLYFIARHKEHALSKQREYLLAGIRALMAGGHFTLAMLEIDRHAGKLEDDSDTLYALIQLARAANDQPRAVRYAKRLLHLSWLGPVVAWLQQLDLRWIGIANADAATDEIAGMPPSEPEQKIKPYAKKSYELAYQVFIENGNLKEAFRVAEAAVKQSPREAVWHRRLVQVSEWSGNQKVALREWLWLLRHGGGQEAEIAVLRLAPVLNDPDALLDVWQRIAARKKLDAVQWNNLESLFEQTGRQREGIAFFERRYTADRLPQHLETAARLAERSGDDARARELYFRLIERHGANAEWTMKIANLYLRKGEYQKAYDLLQKNRSHADAKDVAYWKALADLAWQLQQDSDAMKHYRSMAEAGKLAREDYSRLIYLLGDSRQEEQAALAELAYRRFDDRDMLLRALEIRAASGDRLAQKRLFASVAANRKVDVADSARFYLLRGQYLQAGGDSRAAMSDFRRAAAIAPNDTGTANALLWLLIDARDLPALRAMTAQIVARGEHENPAYWGALAAAYQVLDQPSRAVAYYTRQLKQSGQDFLWLVNYADALEQDGQAGMAARVRRHAWLQLRERFSGKPLKLPYSQDMLAAARLAMMNAPGDPALALVRSVLRQDRLIERGDVAEREVNGQEMGWALALNTRDEATERTVNELVLGWAISTEQSANAKAWLWRRYGQALDRPLWAEASVALAENDTAHLAALLDGQGEGMSMLARHDAANAVGRTGEAQSIIFDGMADNPRSNETQQRLSEDMLAAASVADVELRDEKIGSLRRLVQGARVEMPVSRQLRMAAEYRKTRQANSEPSAFGPIPPAERIAGLVLKNHGKLGDTEIAMRRRNEYANTTEAHLLHDTGITTRLQLHLGAEVNAAATESSDLQVFGMRKQATVGLLYALGKREYLHVEPGWARYYTQAGDYLGSGKHLAWELGYKLRAEYPDWKVRVNGSHTRFNNAANAVLPLPGDANVYGLCGGFGEGIASAYTHAWRPYLDYCATHNNLSGQGYNALLGFAGTVAGRDKLSLTLRQERGGANLANGTSHEFVLKYRYFFD